MKKLKVLTTTFLFLLVGAGVYLNLQRKAAIDTSRIPSKLEEERNFQRWITNAKNKEILVEASEFMLTKEVEIYNTRWIEVYSIDEPGVRETFEETLDKYKDIDKVVFSPSERIFLDYRNINRGNYKAHEVHLYGQKEDKIIDARILECYTKTNCYFDRAYFLDNDVFVVHEISLADPSDRCSTKENCSYTFKIHLVDLINNKRWIYESEEKALELFWAKEEL